MRLLSLAVLSAILVFACAPSETADSEPAADETPTPARTVWVDDSVAEFERKDGFLTLFADQKGGRVFAAFPPADKDGVSLRAIYAAGLTSGLGSNPVGLDRGLFDNGSLISFRRVGNKLIAEQENWTYRASTQNPLERRAVRESFCAIFSLVRRDYGDRSRRRDPRGSFQFSHA